MAKTRNNDGPERRAKSGLVTSDLAKRIALAQGRRSGSNQSEQGQSSTGHLSGLGRAARLGTEFIAAILVGAGIGFVADRVLGTGPWLMLVMLLVGFAAGVMNVVRAASDMNAANPPPKNADLGPDDEDED